MTFKYRPGDPALFSDGKEVGRIFNKAVREALLDHKRAGNPIAGWKNGKVVIIPPEEIPVEDPLLKKPARSKARRRLAQPRRAARRLTRPRRAGA